jgi:tetratricopeptide (TPR) repeat protein
VGRGGTKVTIERGCRIAILGLAAFVLLLPAGLTAQTIAIAGVVVNGQGSPLAGATILLENEGTDTARHLLSTDQSGSFAAALTSPGEWVLSVFAKGYRASRRLLHIDLDTPVEPLKVTLPKNGEGGQATARELQTQLEVADALFRAGDYEHAIALYQSILDSSPSLAAINLHVGRAYRQIREYDRAIEAYQRAVSADPTNERAHLALGLTYFEKGDLGPAEEVFSAAAQHPGAGAEVLFALGEVKAALGKIDEAAAWYQKSADLDVNWGKPLFRLGLAALNRGDREAAAKFLERLLTIDPGCSEAVQARMIVRQLKRSPQQPVVEDWRQHRDR